MRPPLVGQAYEILRRRRRCPDVSPRITARGDSRGYRRGPCGVSEAVWAAGEKGSSAGADGKPLVALRVVVVAWRAEGRVAWRSATRPMGPHRVVNRDLLAASPHPPSTRSSSRFAPNFACRASVSSASSATSLLMTREALDQPINRQSVERADVDLVLGGGPCDRHSGSVLRSHLYHG